MPDQDTRADLAVHDLVGERVSRSPDSPAVHSPMTGETLTYVELWQSAGMLAAELTALGIGRGDVVAIRLGRSVDLVVAMLGIIRSGAAYLCMDADAPDERQAEMLDQARAALVVHPAGGAGETGGVRGLRLVEYAGPLRRSAYRAGADEPVRGDDPIYVVFTSGSTGSPKGVVIPHRAVRRLAVNPTFCTIAPEDRVANVANPAFDATTFEIWNPLVAGGTIVVFPALTEISFSRWSALLVKERIAAMFLTTSLFHLIVRERPGALRSVGTLLAGGEQLDLAVVRRLLAENPPGRLVNAYGPTEATTFAAYYDCTERSLAGLERIPIGYPVQDTSLAVLDEDGQPVGAGEVGELCIGGPGVGLGYLNRAELTEQRFVTDLATGQTIYRTGDRARTLPDGAVELLGRVDRQIKLWGFRIELEEIELAIAATGLVDVAFVEKAGEGPEAILVGFVLPARTATGGSLPRALADALAQRLPVYMIPARWVVLDEVPLGPTGKANRKLLLDRLAEDAPVR